MTKTKEFKLRPDLEQLVRLGTGVTSLRKESKHADINKDFGLVDAAINVFSATSAIGLTTLDPETLRVRTPYDFKDVMQKSEAQFYANLEKKIDDKAYIEARSAYLGSLDQEHKAEFYAEMLSMIPGDKLPKADDKAAKDVKEKQDALRQARQELMIAEALESAVNTGNMQEAMGIARRYMGVEDLGILSGYGLYGGPTFRSAEKNHYLAVAQTRRQIAEALITEKKLYGLIDEGVKAAPHSKAYSLVNMYKAYNSQVEDNKQKEATEKAKGK